MKDAAERSEIQMILWNIMGVLKPWLEEHHIPYFMLGGTLLGAVRHQGFIPWDDDIDLGIPRSQYEAVLKNIQKDLPEHLALRTYWSDPPHHYYFARIVDKRYTLLRQGSLVERKENIWIDLFPLDGMPNQFLRRKLHMLRLLYVRMRYHMSCFDKVNLKRPGRPLSERAVIWLVETTGFGRGSDMHHWLDKLDELLKRYPLEYSNWIFNGMGQYKFKEMFPKKWYEGGSLYPFEDTQLPGPVRADKVLTQMYGDYMTPCRKRNAHAAVFETGLDG